MGVDRRAAKGPAAGTKGGRARRTAKPPTFIEQARREQLIELTIDLIAEHGMRGTTLSRIAEAAGITNAAVIYFFGSKQAIVEAACERVLNDVVTVIAAAVEQAPSARAGLDAYVRTLVGYLVDHPRHLRVTIEMGSDGVGVADSDTGPSSRWQPVAGLIQAAQAAGDVRALDARTTAIALIGAVDAIFAEHLTDPGYDPVAAVEVLLELFDLAVHP